jgi:hypothetical protein
MKVHLAMMPVLVGKTLIKADPEKVYEAVPSKDGKSYTIMLEIKPSP